MKNLTKIHLCYPCGYFRPGDAEDPIAGEYEIINGAVWPKTARLFWDKLKGTKNERAATFGGGILAENGSIQVTCLNETWSVNVEEETVTKSSPMTTTPCSEWGQQLPFLLLVYLASARKEPVAYEMVLPRELFKGIDLFRNRLEGQIHRVAQAFGHDGDGFLQAAGRLGGESIQGGDAATRLHVFPKFPVDTILWLGDREFPAGVTLLVDRNAPLHLPADAIGVALDLLSRRLCQESEFGLTDRPRLS